MRISDWSSDVCSSDLLSLSRHKSLALPGRIDESCAEHMAIFAALKARDPDGAEALTRKHLMRQLEALHTLTEQAERAEPQDAASDAHLTTLQDSEVQS